MLLVEYIEALCSQSSTILTKSLRQWKAGINYEVEFWSRWFETRGLKWPDDYAIRTAPKQLEPWLANLLPPDAYGPSSILDVGAGPITATGHMVPGREITFIAVDPLANFYKEIMDRHGVSPPVRTMQGFAEDLSARFETNQFDLISCTNALDHAIEPTWGVIEMIQVARINGVILLSHRQNEAVFENYSGFHQWNFDVEDDDFIVWNQDRRINVSALLNDTAAVSCKLQNNYLTVKIEKLRDLPIDSLRFNRRLRAGLLEAMIMAG
jgi:hypothetical protein